jgi:hypothetical protein
VFDCYLLGLRESACSTEPHVVRLGYTMSLALRCWFVRDTMRNLMESLAAPIFGRSPRASASVVTDSFAAISRFLLDRADEARRLLGSSILASPRQTERRP